MSEQKIIGIFGCEQTDLCIYLASILENMRNRVLVIDNSFEQKMRFCIPRPNENMNIVTYKNVDYTTLCERSLWNKEGYDFTIVDLGNWPDEKSMSDCDELICALNCEKCEIEKYRELLLHLEHPVSILFRDFCKNYMSTEKIKKILEEENCFVLDQMFLPFSEADECCRLLMQFEGYRNFANLSREFEKVLFHLCRNISGQDYKEVLMGVRRAKRGECF